MGAAIYPKQNGVLFERYGMPPFSVLNTRSGDWQRRKSSWLEKGIESDQGRAEGTVVYHHPMHPDKPLRPSVFDPVLCELVYRWFCPPGGQVIDPFAGGSVRGLMAHLLGRTYWGCDLSMAQVQANRHQARQLLPAGNRPTWAQGDAARCVKRAPLADLLFTCPPYGSLERYSDDPLDLSCMPWPRFVQALNHIVQLAVDKLQHDRFACVVVADLRDHRGYYRNFVSLTIQAFEQAGARLYNEAILVTPVGSGAIRVGAQFEKGRKLLKTHQNVLVFCKGDWRRATAACAEQKG